MSDVKPMEQWELEECAAEWAKADMINAKHPAVARVLATARASLADRAGRAASGEPIYCGECSRAHAELDAAGVRPSSRYPEGDVPPVHQRIRLLAQTSRTPSDPRANHLNRTDI